MWNRTDDPTAQLGGNNRVTDLRRTACPLRWSGGGWRRTVLDSGRACEERKGDALSTGKWEDDRQ